MEPTTVYFLILFLIGSVSGFINTIAGGGSLITLPILMLLGMPAQIANATNRVGILLSAIAGLVGYYKKGHLPKENAFLVTTPTIIGGIFGALTASYTPSDILKYVLVTCMIAVSFVMLLKSNLIRETPQDVSPEDLKKYKNRLYLFGAGFYGGFIQAGVGFILLAVLCIAMNFDLLKGNAFKILTAFFFTFFSLIVFICRDQVLFIPGLMLGLGGILGSTCAVKFATSIDQGLLKKIIVFIVVTACIVVVLK